MGVRARQGGSTVNWWQIVLVVFGFGLWSAFMLLLGAAIVKSSYTVPKDPRILERDK